MGKNPAERKHSMLTRQATQSRTIQKDEACPHESLETKTNGIQKATGNYSIIPLQWWE